MDFILMDHVIRPGGQPAFGEPMAAVIEGLAGSEAWRRFWFSRYRRPLYLSILAHPDVESREVRLARRGGTSRVEVTVHPDAYMSTDPVRVLEELCHDVETAIEQAVAGFPGDRPDYPWGTPPPADLLSEVGALVGDLGVRETDLPGAALACRIEGRPGRGDRGPAEILAGVGYVEVRLGAVPWRWVRFSFDDAERAENVRLLTALAAAFVRGEGCVEARQYRVCLADAEVYVGRRGGRVETRRP